MDPPQNPPQNPPRGGSSSSSGRNSANINSNPNTNNGGGDGANRRLPKVDVYIPRHRRGPNDDASNSLPPSESADSRQSSTSSSPRQAAPRNTLTTTRSNSSYGRDDGFEDTSSSSRSGNNSSSSGDVQRRGRGKFMGPGTNGGGSGGSKTSGGNGGTRGNGGRDRDYRGSGSSGNSGSSRNNNNSNKTSGYGSASTSSPSSQQLSPTTAQAPAAARHPPRGRDFDATVLRRYSDDENRPNSSFSRSSSYTSTRSSNNNQSSSTSTLSRSTGRSQDTNAAASRRPDRSDEGSWRREVPKSTETTTATGTSGTAEGKDQESDLAAQFESVRLSTSASASRFGSPDGTESTDEPEEWELALQNSDDDGIPAAPKDTRRHPAEALLTSPSSTPSKIGNWSEGRLSSSFLIFRGVIWSVLSNWLASDILFCSSFPKLVSNDDMYILELYDFSASIKTAHLTDMFAVYENRSGGFRIKWVDETKALVIFESAAVGTLSLFLMNLLVPLPHAVVVPQSLTFSSPLVLIAKQAYIANLTNQIAKIKPYNGPDKDSIRNTGKPSSGAYNGVRPAKTDSVARRLVQGALGLRVRRTPEQIAEEKAQIQAAKGISHITLRVFASLR